MAAVHFGGENRVEALVDQIVSEVNPMVKLQLIERFNGLQAQDLSPDAQKTFDQSLDLIQSISQQAMLQLEETHTAYRAQPSSSHTSISSEASSTAPGRNEKVSSLRGRASDITRNYLIPGAKKVFKVVGTKTVIAEAVSYCLGGWKVALAVGALITAIRIRSSYLQRSNPSTSTNSSPSASPRQNSSLVGRVSTIVNDVGKANTAAIAVGIGSYIFAGWPGAIATGALYLGARVGLPHFWKKEDSAARSTAQAQPLAQRTAPVVLQPKRQDPAKSPAPVNRDPFPLEAEIRTAAPAHRSSVQPAPIAASKSATTVSICPISGKEIPEGRSISVNGKNYDIAYLIVDLLLKDTALDAQKDPDSKPLELQIQLRLITFCGLTNSQFYSLFFSKPDKSERLQEFLIMVEKNNRKGKDSVAYLALMDPIALALSMSQKK